MKTCVFLGPTMPVVEARNILDADYLPPAQQGDVYRAIIDRRPQWIGIVDGYFHQVPSVWHKEILFAMAEGVHVVGSASMGALRAAELDAFGMEGIGQVYAAFRDGVLEDDDEVAVVHGPAELGFVAASEAMVNIRATLDAALAEGLLAKPTAEHLRAAAKSLYYPKRNYMDMLKRGRTDGLPEAELGAFAAWLDRGRIDAKRDDAVLMLRHMKARLDDHATAKAVDYSFEHTTMWETATSAMRRAKDRDDGFGDVWLLDELRLEVDNERLGFDALLHLLALDEADRRGLRIDDDERRDAINAFRHSRKLHRGADLRTWLAAHHLDRKDIDRLLMERLLQDKVRDRLHKGMTRIALDACRLRDDYEQLYAYAAAKRDALEGTDEDRELTDGSFALTWFFKDRIGMSPPDDLDRYARQRGFRDGADFKRAVTQDYRYRRICKKAPFDDV